MNRRLVKQEAMRNGQNHHNHSNHNHSHNKQRMRGRARKGQNPLTRVYESNGPDLKVRGTANHIAEKYVQLARDAQSSGDPVAAENYYQHAEHYFRLIAAVQEQFRQTQPFQGEGQAGGYDDSDEDSMEGMAGEPFAPREQQSQQPYQQQREQQPYQPREQQPYQQREQQPYQQPYQPREGRFNRDRDRDNQPRDNQPREHQPREQQSYPPRPQPQMAPPPTEDGSDVDQLPAFVTGGAPQPAGGQNGNGQNGPNGAEGQTDRFPLHRRRRRRNGPREGAVPGSESAPGGE